MNEDTDQRQGTPRRAFVVDALGDTADEIELAALDAAREFFGDDVRLEVVRDYVTSAVHPAGINAKFGKKYQARVTVRAAG